MAEPEQEPIINTDKPETPATPATVEPLVTEPILAPVPVSRPRKVSASMLGPLEIAALAVGAIAILAAFMAYFFFVVPSSRELARNKSEADRLDAELISARSKYGEITDTEVAVEKLTASVDDFETRYLPVTSTGQAALYQRLNGLIAAYDLVNTTGPDYTPLETAEQHSDQQSDEEKGRAKFRSLYPGVYISTTLEGSYQNLRRFIREIETGREFIVVSAVELAPTESENQQKDKSNATVAQGPVTPPVNTPLMTQMGRGGFPMGGPTAAPMVQTPAQFNNSKQKGKMHGETVSLHIEMAAYFRRPNFVPAQ